MTAQPLASNYYFAITVDTYGLAFFFDCLSFTAFICYLQPGGASGEPTGLTPRALTDPVACQALVHDTASAQQALTCTNIPTLPTPNRHLSPDGQLWQEVAVRLLLYAYCSTLHSVYRCQPVTSITGQQDGQDHVLQSANLWHCMASAKWLHTPCVRKVHQFYLFYIAWPSVACPGLGPFWSASFSYLSCTCCSTVHGCCNCSTDTCMVFATP